MKKLVAILMAIALTLSFSGVSNAASKSGSFSGGSKSSISRSYSGSTSGSKVYSSGSKRPSSNVTQRPYSNSHQTYTQSKPKSSWFGGGIGHFFGGLATGAIVSSMFSHMFHPFGGGYGYGGYGGGGFSFWGLLIDLFLLYLAYKLIRRLFFR